MKDFDFEALDIGPCQIDQDGINQLCEFRNCLIDGLALLRKLVKNQIIKSVISGLIILVENLCPEPETKE